MLRGWWKISRPCYDKPRRCPGWNGGGTKDARVERCPGGHITFGSSLAAMAHFTAKDWSRYPRWNALGQCTKCDVVVLPYWIRLVDPTYWLRWKLRWAMQDLRTSVDNWIEDWWADR